MKLRLAPPIHGTVLVTTIVITGVVTLAMGAYLTMVASQNRTVISAYSWNTALPYAEAGIEEAMTHAYRANGTNLAVNGWTADAGGWVRSNSIVDGSYQVRLVGGGTNYTIESTGSAPRVLLGGDPIPRTVRITATRRPRFPGIVALDYFKASGSATFDSYDSSNPLYSTNGMYSPTKAKDGAFIGTNSQTNNSVVGGNVKIKGSLATGPGGSVTSGGSISVGDNSYTSTGIQSGHLASDFNYSAPDVQAPYSSGLGLGSPLTVNGTNYTTVLGVSGGQYYHANNFSGSILVTAPTTLYVVGNVSTPLIRILPGGSLTLYVGGTSFAISGGSGIVNEGGKPENLTINGLPSVTTIGLGGNQSFTGSLYAPNATLNCNGTVDFFGAMVLKGIDGVGNMEFHFDEALLKGQLGDFLITAWDEI